MRRTVASGPIFVIALLGLGISVAQAGAPSTPPIWSSPVIGRTHVNHLAYTANWAGYVAIGGASAFDQASASWTVPSLTCPAGQSSYSSFWVGLDGWTSTTVEQTGTEADCRNGTPTYYAWYGAFPKRATVCPFAVSGGDTISASVDFSAGRFTLSLTDAANACGTSFSLRRAQRSSAEAIAEAPSSSHSSTGILPLADFGTAQFTGAEANSAALAGAGPTEVIMTSTGTSTGTVRADPENSLSGGSFSVTWKHA
jgi:hypothetical protein